MRFDAPGICYETQTSPMWSIMLTFTSSLTWAETAGSAVSTFGNSLVILWDCQLQVESDHRVNLVVSASRRSRRGKDAKLCVQEVQKNISHLHTIALVDLRVVLVKVTAYFEIYLATPFDLTLEKSTSCVAKFSLVQVCLIVVNLKDSSSVPLVSTYADARSSFLCVRQHQRKVLASLCRMS